MCNHLLLSIHACTEMPEVGCTKIYRCLCYHLLDVKDEKNPAKCNKNHVKKRLFSMKTSQASSEGVFQQVCKGQDEYLIGR